MAEPLTVETFTSSGFGQNAYLVRCNRKGVWWAIDPGGEASAMADRLEGSGEALQAIVLTHAHLDHFEGVADLVERLPAPILLNPADRPLYDAAAQQAAMFGHTVRPPPPPDAPLEEGPLDLGSCTFDVRPAPGHSPGHMILYSESAGLAIVGDVVFAGSIGRTDLPGGSFEQLMASIRDQVLSLPDETRLLCGHGPVTTVERERKTNPFLSPNHPGRMA